MASLPKSFPSEETPTSAWLSRVSPRRRQSRSRARHGRVLYYSGILKMKGPIQDSRPAAFRRSFATTPIRSPNPSLDPTLSLGNTHGPPSGATIEFRHCQRFCSRRSHIPILDLHTCGRGLPAFELERNLSAFLRGRHRELHDLPRDFQLRERYGDERQFCDLGRPSFRLLCGYGPRLGRDLLLPHDLG